ncbi:MAG: hypothetical protein E7639_04150 [Ruminococcaceae bacterium]|nr:hypothetical protein [Oscillospiraceae bacterium]
MNNMLARQQSDAKYKSARASLLMIVALSLVNIFAISFGDMYFLFSSYITQLLSTYGAVFYAETGEMLYLVIAIVLSLISVIPYLLFYIFSKNRPGCMIAALVLFSIDSLAFFVDFLLLLLAGDLSFVIDLIFRIWALVSLVMAVKYGFEAKKQSATAANDPMPVYGGEVSEEYAANAAIQRRLRLERPKRFVGMAARMECYLDGRKVGELKNGADLMLTMDANPHQLLMRVPNGTAVGGVDIAGGTEDRSYEVSMRTGALTASIVVTSKQFSHTAN